MQRVKTFEAGLQILMLSYTYTYMHVTYSADLFAHGDNWSF